MLESPCVYISPILNYYSCFRGSSSEFGCDDDGKK